MQWEHDTVHVAVQLEENGLLGHAADRAADHGADLHLAHPHKVARQHAGAQAQQQQPVRCRMPDNPGLVRGADLVGARPWVQRGNMLIRHL